MRFSLRRRPTAREDAAADAPADPDAPPGHRLEPGGSDEAGHALRAPSRLHAAEIYGGGEALTALAAITEVLTAVDGYNAESTSNDAEQLRTIIQQRTASLAENEVIKAE